MPATLIECIRPASVFRSEPCRRRYVRSLQRLAKSSRAGLKMRVPARGDDTGTTNRFGDLIADRLGTITVSNLRRLRGRRLSG